MNNSQRAGSFLVLMSSLVALVLTSATSSSADDVNRWIAVGVARTPRNGSE